MPKPKSAKRRGSYDTKPRQIALPPQAERLRAWRKFRGLTQPELADKSGYSIGTISGLESGDAGYSDKSRANIAKALGITEGMLLEVDPTGQHSLWSLIARADKEELAEIERAAAGVLAQRPPRRR